MRIVHNIIYSLNIHCYDIYYNIGGHHVKLSLTNADPSELDRVFRLFIANFHTNVNTTPLTDDFGLLNHKSDIAKLLNIFSPATLLSTYPLWG